jgi:membrane associated rhomboid family serine protease
VGSQVSYKIAAGEYWRLLTPIFVHGNLLHVLVNTFAVWNLGRFAEPRLGSSTFLGVYLGSGEPLAGAADLNCAASRSAIICCLLSTAVR